MHMGSVEREYLSHAACAKKMLHQRDMQRQVGAAGKSAIRGAPTLPKQTENHPKWCANLHSAHSHASAAHQSKQATVKCMLVNGNRKQSTAHIIQHLPDNLSLVPTTVSALAHPPPNDLLQAIRETPRCQRRANSDSVRNSKQSRC